MAFDWLGTFNKSQFDRFAEFARQQLGQIGRRSTHLQLDLERLGNLQFVYNTDGTPAQWSVSSSDTYIGRLIAAYEILGGNVLFDLQVRAKTETQVVYMLPGSEAVPPTTMSNGDIIGARGLGDGLSAEYMQSARSWLAAPLHYRRTYLERKVRRAIDYRDQLEEEVQLLKTIQSDAKTYDSLEYIFTQINGLFPDFQYRAIYDDKGKDPHGKHTMAPFLPYSLTQADPEVVGTVPHAPGRDDDGFREGGV